MTAAKVKKATTGVYLATGFTNGVNLEGLAMANGSIKVLLGDPARVYGINVPKVTVSGNQGQVGSASFAGEGVAYSLVEGENGAIIPDLAVSVKVALVNQDLTLNVTETLTLEDGSEKTNVLPVITGTHNSGNPVQYI